MQLHKFPLHSTESGVQLWVYGEIHGDQKKKKVQSSSKEIPVSRINNYKSDDHSLPLWK